MQVPEVSEGKRSFERPFRKIMVATDVSERAERLIQVSAYLSGALNAEVVIVTVSQVPTSVQGNESDGYPANREERETMDALRKTLDESFGESSDKIDVKVLHGDPAKRVVEYADFSGADLVIIGSRGQGSLRRAMLGSVSESVVAKSERPVLVVK